MLTLVFSLLLSGCVSGVPVSIQNQSASELTHVVVSGNGFSESVGTIRAGKSELVRIRPRVETAVKISFEANGRRYSATTSNELENDNTYTVEAVVSPEFSVSLSTPLR